MLVLALALLLQAAIPAPVGYVNDFAHVLDPSSVAHMTSLIDEVRRTTRGDIVVVTLPDLGGRAESDVALQVGREWKVGGAGEAGDPARNLGVVLLLVPRRDHRPGTGAIFISTGRGAEGFLPDARVGRIRDAMGPFLAREEYGAAVALGVDLLAQAFAQEFGVTLDNGSPPEPEPAAGSRFPWILLLVVIFLLLRSRGRLFFLPFGGRWGGSGGGGGWGGGGGGGFGGGFGGFGGGGGFSGGGAGGRF